MPKMQPQEILLAHDAWATRNIIAACEPLTEAQFSQRFEMGPGSLQETTTHILGAMRRWEDALRGRELRPRIELDGKRRTAAELLKLAEETTTAFGQAARMGGSDMVTMMRDGKQYTFPRTGIVMHVMTHGMHHRAQCLNMLRHVGVKALPLSSMTEWMREVGLAT